MHPVRSQRGIAAVEFVLVLGFFLIVLQCIATYGAVFVVQQSLARAATEGARAMLDAQAASAPATGTGSTLRTPEQMATAAAGEAIAWLSDFRRSQHGLPAIAPRVQPADNCAPLVCRSVTVSYDSYDAHPLVPRLFPGMPVPASLSASATVQLDPALWVRAGGS